jgi:hypothetical protein
LCSTSQDPLDSVRELFSGFKDSTSASGRMLDKLEVGLLREPNHWVWDRTIPKSVSSCIWEVRTTGTCRKFHLDKIVKCRLVNSSGSLNPVPGQSMGINLPSTRPPIVSSGSLSATGFPDRTIPKSVSSCNWEVRTTGTCRKFHLDKKVKCHKLLTET